MTAMPTAAWPKPGESLTLTGVDFDWFVHLAKRDRTGTRLTYDHGTLELMAPSFLHDRSDRILARFVVTLTEELGLAIVEGGTTTLKRRSLKKGIEADEIFWIANASAMAGKQSINLKIDPPPDLAIEVDVTQSSLNRLAIYGSLGIPEIWRYRNQQLSFLIRQPDESYRSSQTSLAFPFVTAADLLPFHDLAIQSGNTNAAVASLRDWIRRNQPTV